MSRVGTYSRGRLIKGVLNRGITLLKHHLHTFVVDAFPIFFCLFGLQIKLIIKSFRCILESLVLHKISIEMFLHFSE